MGKIVVLASDEDAEAAKAALDGAGVDYEVVEPTPSNILHIVIGMVDDGEEPKDEEPKEEEPKASKGPRTDDAAPPAEEDLPVEESLGTIKVDGEDVNAVRGVADFSVLYAPLDESGPRLNYKLNESSFAFWPADAARPMARVLVAGPNGGASVEVVIKNGEPRFVVGKDLASIF